jgi:hypothetical protein
MDLRVKPEMGRLQKELLYLIGGALIYYDLLHELFITEVPRGKEKDFKRNRGHEIDGVFCALLTLIFLGAAFALIVVPLLWDAPLPMAVGFYVPAYGASRMMGGRLK